MGGFFCLEGVCFVSNSYLVVPRWSRDGPVMVAEMLAVLWDVWRSEAAGVNLLLIVFLIYAIFLCGNLWVKDGFYFTTFIYLYNPNL